MTAAKTTLVTAVEVRMPQRSPVTVWDMPMKVEHRAGMGGPPITALIFWVLGGETAVTVLLSDGDKRDLINMLRRKS